jgi:hypothetical protein
MPRHGRALLCILLLLVLGGTVDSAQPPVSPPISPPPIDPARLETEILTGLHTMKRAEDLSALREKVNQLQKIEAGPPRARSGGAR